MTIRNISALTAFLISSNLLGATPPSSSDILRQAELPKVEKQDSVVPDIKVPEYKAPMVKSDIQIALKNFKITKNTVFSENELLQLLKKYENSEVTFDKLNEAASVITKYYRDKGYFVARAYIPAQELSKSDAVVEISVIEGLFGKFNLKNSSIVNDATIIGFLNQLHQGEVISTANIERQTLLINDLAGANVANVEILPGTVVGTSDFGVETTGEPKYYGYAIADNYGSRYTGEYRLNVAGYVNSVSGRGDTLGISALGSNTADMKNGRISYTTPLGYSGVNLDSSVGYTTYALGKEFESLEIKGKSTTFDMGVSYPFLKTKNHTLKTSLSYNYKNATDEDNYQADRNKKLNSLKLGIFDTFRTVAGAIDSSLVFTAGDVTLGDYAKSIDTLSTDGKYSKLNLSLSQTQLLSNNFSLSGKINAQTSFTRNLDGGEDFSAGGASGVRAYTDSELSGDKGYLASLELAYKLPTQSFSIFVDHAKVWDNTKDVANVAPETRLLSAAGIGYNISYKDASLKLSYAHGFGVDKTPTGDGDNTNLNRVFAQAMVRF